MVWFGLVWFLGCGGYKYRHVYVYVFKTSFELMPVELVFFLFENRFSTRVWDESTCTYLGVPKPNQTKFIGLWIAG